MIAVARQRLQLAFLALEASAERVADQRSGCRAGLDDQQWAVVHRCLMRQQHHRIGLVLPAQRLLTQHQRVGTGSLGD